MALIQKCFWPSCNPHSRKLVSEFYLWVYKLLSKQVIPYYVLFIVNITSANAYLYKAYLYALLQDSGNITRYVVLFILKLILVSFHSFWLQMDIVLTNQVVILDEAHNIEDSSREAASYAVMQDQLGEAASNLRIIGMCWIIRFDP